MQVAASVNFAPEKLIVRTKLGFATHHHKRSRVRPVTAAWSGFSNLKAPEPVWVETNKGVPNVAVVKPDNPCNVCLGKGKVTCGTCEGKGTYCFVPQIYKASLADLLHWACLCSDPCPQAPSHASSTKCFYRRA